MARGEIKSFHEQRQPLTSQINDVPLPDPPPSERSPSDYSRIWRSQPYIERTSMETITYDEPPAKYIGPEMKKASQLLRRRRHGNKLARSSRLLRQSMLWWLPEAGWMVVGLSCVITLSPCRSPSNLSSIKPNLLLETAFRIFIFLDPCTGSCDWPDFTSLGICTKVVNVSSYLTVSSVPDSDGSITKEKASYSASLAAINMTLLAPNLHSLALSVSSAPSLSFRGSNIETALLDTYLIYGNPSFSFNARPTFFAVEILYYWCAQRHSIQVVDGEVTSTISETPSSISNNAKSLAAQFNSGVSSCFEGSTDVNCSSGHWGQLTLKTRDSQATELIVKELTAGYLSKVVASSFGGGIDTPVPRGGNFLQGLNPQIYKAEGDLAWAIGASLFPDPHHPSDPLVQFQDISNLAGNIALSLSNWLRSVGDRSNSSVTGTAMVNQTYIVIHWAWLAFLLCQILLTAVLLATVVIWTRVEHIQIIKTTSLAGMVALDDGSRAHLGGINDLSGLSTRAARVNMKLEKSSVSGLAMGLTTSRDGAAMAPSFTGGHTATRKRKYQREKEEQMSALGPFTV
ncbi:hypothetical protein B0T22DRAFT_513927 [Podospora appendiculata]|uniref:Transmembrane protein n=1 Tax=Podospora appendiculata TaxID=314037 RepID=A0AAE0XBN1_9PEZI|nr:hypothetical protein B0T22DRAFT_513927 [Podospora appendiculata]